MFYFGLGKVRRFYLFHKMYNKGINKENLGEYPKALHFLFYALSLRSGSLKTYKAIARVNRKNKAFLNALDFYSKAIDRYPDNDELFALKADVHRRIKEYDLAIKHYNVAIQINENNVEYYKNRAQIKYYIDDIQGAINDYTTAIEKAPNDSFLYMQRGFCMLNKKMFDSAKEDLKKANNLKPNNKHIQEMLKILG